MEVAGYDYLLLTAGVKILSICKNSDKGFTKTCSKGLKKINVYHIATGKDSICTISL